MITKKYFIIFIIFIIILQTVYSNQNVEIYLSLGHTGNISSTDFSSDGKYILYSDFASKIIKLYNVATGKLDN
ncbi:MAG: hypothetical protein A2086_01275 [Spirochaetes bacterium GWD1_27_9]|nr:MAG: hypothetical protein A2Z98_13035 [Spirochaetes bacterium GWB1_27_13]OHD44350.1 MAG: hypothetical protein A2086_01275 [Spirochaetes bacterium GWD1_27_9]